MIERRHNEREIKNHMKKKWNGKIKTDREIRVRREEREIEWRERREKTSQKAM